MGAVVGVLYWVPTCTCVGPVLPVHVRSKQNHSRNTELFNGTGQVVTGYKPLIAGIQDLHSIQPAHGTSVVPVSEGQAEAAGAQNSNEGHYTDTR